MRDDVLRFLESYRDEIEEARKINFMFTKKNKGVVYFPEICWPDDLVLLGNAEKIGYRSDKWNKDGEEEDYIHSHKEPLPFVLVQRPIDPSDDLEHALFKQDSFRIQFQRPEPLVFPFLADGLDLQFERNGETLHLDWKQGELPFLCGDINDEHLLVAVPRTGGYPVILWSEILIVTERGIEN